MLRRLCYPASVRQFDPSQYYSYVGDSRNRAQIGPAGWVPDYLVASNFLDLFKCKTFVPRSDWENLNLFEFCDSALDAEMKQAQAVQGSDSSRAAELYSDVDRKLVDRAVAVPFGSPRKEVLVSERVGNFQAHPLWGTLLDQLWVR